MPPVTQQQQQQQQQINGINQDYTNTHPNNYYQPMRLEHEVYAESQLQPLPSSYHTQTNHRQNSMSGNDNDPSLEPVIAILSMQLKLERLLAQERKVSRGLNNFSNTLQMRIHEYEVLSLAKDAHLKNLENENNRLSRAMNNTHVEPKSNLNMGPAVNGASGAKANGVNLHNGEKTPTTFSDYQSVTDFSPSGLMLPPLQIAGTTTSLVPSKRKSNSPTSPLAARKRPATRATIHPASPRPTYNSSKTPSPMDPFRIAWE